MAAFSGWAASVLRAIKAPVTKANIAWLEEWQRNEGGGASYNPLNTTQGAKGASDYNRVGVKNYPTASAGVDATAKTLLNGHYSTIVSALRSGNPGRFLSKPARAQRASAQLSVWGSTDFAATISKATTAITDPLAPKFTYGRIDQGIDVVQSSPYKAVGAGTIVAIGGFAEGEGVASHTAVYEKLNKPITVDGRTYDEVYYAETKPLVKVGEHVSAGQAVEAGGSSELGFATGNAKTGYQPAGPLKGGLGGGTQATVQGADFARAAISAAALARYEKDGLKTPGTNAGLLDLGKAAAEVLTTNTGGLSAGAATGGGNPVATASAVASAAAGGSGGGMFGGLESWMAGVGKLVLAYVLLIGVAGALFVAGMKNLGVKTPKLPTTVPVPV